MKTKAEEYFIDLQNSITSSLERIDGLGVFREDRWERPGGGGGRTRIMNEGSIFEKAGVNYSAVYGSSPEMLQTEGDRETTFFASGISLVLHPRSPIIPTIHANFRYFEKSNGHAWFGGGIDLTPYYLDEDDVRFFHNVLKQACEKHNTLYYTKFKNWCDEYFYIKHRDETRGVGGLFFDHLGGNENELEGYFSFVQEVGNSFLNSYLPIVSKHKDESYSDIQRNWQLLRRGRYVEFNLIYDRGTLFGLQTSGRTESILMSLPPNARWEYDYQPKEGTAEAALIEILRNPKEWV